MYRQLKKYTYDVLSGQSASNTGRAVTVFILTLIVLNVLAVIIGTIEPLETDFHAIFHGFEVFSIIIFTIEYILRIWSCTEDQRYKHAVVGRIKYAFSPMALIDLAAVLPFYIPMWANVDLRFLRALRLLRFFRLFKLARYSRAMNAFGSAIKSKKEELILSVTIVVILLILASSVMYFVENEAQPDGFSSIPAAMWWGVATLTTVGYGDVYPITTLGKIIGGIIALLGIAMFALPTGIISTALIEEIQKRRTKKTICPHCGKEIESN